MVRELNYLLFVAIALLQVIGIGCWTQAPEGRVRSAPANEDIHIEQTPVPKSVDPGLLALSPSALCDRLDKIEVIDDRDPEGTDDIYKAIISKDAEALPCLIDKINDRTKVPDPRSAPKWQQYVVGDTAVFAILDIVSKDDLELWEALFLEPLPSASKEEWKTNGVYAYFNYVSEDKNRKALQVWWRKRLQENQK